VIGNLLDVFPPASSNPAARLSAGDFGALEPFYLGGIGFARGNNAVGIFLATLDPGRAPARKSGC